MSTALAGSLFSYYRRSYAACANVGEYGSVTANSVGASAISINNLSDTSSFLYVEGDLTSSNGSAIEIQNSNYTDISISNGYGWRI